VNKSLTQPSPKERAFAGRTIKVSNYVSSPLGRLGGAKKTSIKEAL